MWLVSRLVFTSYKSQGCWSFMGNIKSSSGQEVSLAPRCNKVRNTILKIFNINMQIISTSFFIKPQ